MTGPADARVSAGDASAGQAPAPLEVVGRTRHVQLNASLIGGGTLVVTFAPRGASPASIWGLTPLRKAGVSAVGFVDFADAWYPAREIDELFPAFNEIAKNFERIVTYGHSMGGYGALKFGRRLGAGRTVAMAPSWSVAPSDVGAFNQRRVKAFYRRELHEGMAIRPPDVAEDAIVVVDPYHPDDRGQFHAIVAAGCPIRAVPSHFLGHGVLNATLETGAAVDLVREVATGQGPAGVRRVIRANRARSPRYVAGALRKLQARGRDAAWGRFAEAYATGFGDNDYVRAALLRVEAERRPNEFEPVFPGEPGWTAFFEGARPEQVAIALADVGFEGFLAPRLATRWLAVHAHVGDYERIDAFLDALIPTLAPAPSRMVALARTIMRKGKGAERYVAARRLAEAAVAAGAAQAEPLLRTCALAAPGGAVRLPATFFTATSGERAVDSWRLDVAAPDEEIVRSRPIELPPGRFKVELDIAGGRLARRSLAPDGIGVSGESCVSRRGPIVRAARRLGLGAGANAVLIEIRGRDHRPPPSIYLLGRSRRFAKASVEFRGADIIRT